MSIRFYDGLLWPDLYEAFIECAIFGCAIYEVLSEQPPKLEPVGIWSFFPKLPAEYEEIDATQRPRALKFLEENHDHIIRHPNCPVNERGERWWQCIVASGPARRAGYVMSALISAKEQNDVERAIERIQAVMGQYARH